MVDFVTIATRQKNKSTVEVYPKFIIKKSSDLMIRGGDFYAIWVEERQLWSTDEEDVIRIVDKMIKDYISKADDNYYPMYMWDASSGSIDAWHKYVQKQLRDNFHPLDEKLVFANTVTTKESYSSKRLSYPLEPGDTKAWDKIIGTLYSPDERRKIEWAIGAIVSGDSKNIQKFLVLYGSAGTGKSTILNIIQQLFEGYYSVFDAKALGQSSNQFALEAFKSNPLVAIQHDGDLSRIEDNTRLNSLVSHELMTVNEKFKSAYANRFNAFLLMGTNKPVKITDAKSGLIRRLIDVTPSGEKLPVNEYNRAIAQVNFELGPIAQHCLEVYERNPGYYDDYIPISMLGSTNDFFNFVEESYFVFKKENCTTLKIAWAMYQEYCDEAKVAYPLSKRAFKEELKNYFHEYKERGAGDDGGRIRNLYSGFITEKFDDPEPKSDETPVDVSGLVFEEQDSIFDTEFADCLAQLATDEGTPKTKWENVETKLKDIDTKQVHYVRLPENHIVIDFDIPGPDGKKSFELNLKAASKWPATYAELSKSGAGIHLHYIYQGDVSKLSRVYDDHIEVKVFTGNSALRRCLTKCMNTPIATISSGLPLKEDKKMIDNTVIQSERGLRQMIIRNLNKEIHDSTKPSIDFIAKILDDAYESGMHYDVSDMRQAVLTFAASSTHQAELCVKIVGKMKFKSEETSAPVTQDEAPIAFYDVEVFPNLFLVNYKLAGEGNPVIRLINPTPGMIEEMLQYRLIGFNCRRYDNHMIYACLMGYDNKKLYELSQRIVSGESRDCLFSEAYNLSYTDVYDFASAGNKMSLKKHEIRLGIHHQELGLPWDEPVPKELWPKVAEYCDNDVIATEAVFDDLKGDWVARQILADLAEMTVNDTTNTLTTRIIFGKNRKPQNEFHYRNMAEPVMDMSADTYNFLAEACPKMMEQTHGEAGSLLPYFPGYEYKNGKSTYRDEEVGEGGYVYSEPGMYGNVALLDVASMHPHSLIAECLFGVRFTKAFRDIVEGRVSIKHKAWEEVNNMLDGKLTKWIEKVKSGEMKAKDLANGLKTAINSVYGLTSAKFDNPFRDPRNVDNIVAKRGALFMIDLKHAVQERGFKVAHIKTDSIKIPDATPEIIKFVMDFGEKYGYTFEHEATYDRMCLVNKAVYIAKYATPEKCQELYGYVPGDNDDHGNQWTATGDQFAVPYIFKTLFSHEPLEFKDFCETFQVSKGDLYLDMNENLPDVSEYENELSKLESKYKKGLLYDITFESEADRLNALIEPGHDLHFVGRVGRFTPIKPGKGGGVLYRRNEGKNFAASGSTGYRWMESEMVQTLGREDDIDKSFYQKLADDAIQDISLYGIFDWFVSDDPYIQPDYEEGRFGLYPVYPESVPFN